MVEGSKESMENDTTLDEDSTEEPEKEHTSGDEATAEENVDEEKNEEKNGDEDEEEDEDEREKDESEEESESEYSESEESDSYEGEAEDRRQKYVLDMNDLEKQFADLKEQLYKERITQIDDQLGKVNQMNWEKKKKIGVEVTSHAHSMEAKEYTGPLKQLEQDCEIRTEVAGFLKHYKTINLENQLQCELQSAEQHFQNEERDLCNTLMAEFEEKLRKVEEERHTAEMYSDLWCDDSFRNRKKRKGMEIFIPEKRKKPVTVTGPYIVYMLNEMDILEDWAAIRKAKSELARRKASELSSDKDDPYVTARYEDGKFFYQGEWFQKGDKVILDNRIDFPVNATITGINTGEVWVSKRDGVKCKLYIAQFQKGKYVMRRGPEEETIL